MAIFIRPFEKFDCEKNFLAEESDDDENCHADHEVYTADFITDASNIPVDTEILANLENERNMMILTGDSIAGCTTASDADTGEKYTLTWDDLSEIQKSTARISI